MAYLGNTPTTQGFIPAIDFFSGNGSTTAFTLSRPVASVAQVQATIENVPQNPGTAFTVSGNTITFDGAPPSGTNNIYVYYTSPITQVVALPQSPQVFGNLQFSSPGARITGDFSSATTAAVSFQSTVTNGVTAVTAIPNGTSQGASFRAFNVIDQANASWGYLGIPGGGGDVRVISGSSGTGTLLPLTMYTGGSESLRLSATSKALILAGGSTSANGTGITFPASQSASSDANTLDDYEEGTWTPALSYNSSNPTVTYTEQVGRYTKIGNIVSFSFSMQWTGLSGGTGNVGVTLPFTTSSTASFQGATFTAYAGGLSVNIGGSSYVDPGANRMLIRVQADNTGLLQPANVGSSGHFIFGGVYRV